MILLILGDEKCIVSFIYQAVNKIILMRTFATGGDTIMDCILRKSYKHVLKTWPVKTTI
jgi:hypothetical protein